MSPSPPVGGALLLLPLGGVSSCAASKKVSEFRSARYYTRTAKTNGLTGEAAYRSGHLKSEDALQFRR
jgi:hypothetical protein